MRSLIFCALASSSLTMMSTSALAQAGANVSDDEIVVQARRKDEALNDVPLTVNAVSSESIQKLNIRELKDISSVVPGLTLNPGNRTTGAVSSLRGLAVDTTASGNNGTVEFYLNDTPISAGAVLQGIYDLGQIEVLRGPQGTLRGRASPSGSITITTHRVNMTEWGGYAQATATTLDGINVQGAVNAPLVPGILAIRIAAMSEDNEGSRIVGVRSSNYENSSKTRSARLSVRFTPDDNLELGATYTRLNKRAVVWDQVESACLATGTCSGGTGANGTQLIQGRDRLAIENVPNTNRQQYDIFNWRAEWNFAGQKLNYAGSSLRQDLRSIEPFDKGDFFNPTYPGDASLPNNNETYNSAPASGLNLQNAGQAVHVMSKLETHEFRISSDERLFGIFDYVVGAFVSKQRPWSDLYNISFAGFSGGMISPATFTGLTASSLQRRGRTLERAAFGNLTVHLGETEVSGGIRFIEYQENLNGTNNKFTPKIWNASVKHRFGEELMIYATAGSSWRVGSGSNGLIIARTVSNPATITDPVLQALIPITPETSKSYEVGFRSNLFDNKVTLNISAFHQDFKNYIFSVPTFIFLNQGVSRQTVSSLAAPVNAKVDGIEGEFAFRPSRHFNIGGSVAYARSKMTGVIPCNPPGNNAANIPAGQEVSRCAVDQNAGRAAPFSASVQSEYSHSITEQYNGFVRGLMQFYGNNANDPQNIYDDVKSYALFNLYAGVRAEDGSWEVAAYGKNILNTYRVTDRGANAATVATNLGTRFSDYRLISSTDPREFGIMARFAFGSR